LFGEKSFGSGSDSTIDNALCFNVYRIALRQPAARASPQERRDHDMTF
jgi:hypothetical protein